MPAVSTSSPAPQFGPNEWLVEEMYEQFLSDPSSVDPAWHDFFADYKPTQRATSQAVPTTKLREEAAAANGQVGVGPRQGVGMNTVSAPAATATVPKPPPAP